MKVSEALVQVEKFCTALKQAHPEMAFGAHPIKRHETAFKDWFRDEVPYRDCSKKSGVYIFADEESNILYIGKAGSDNFAAEIYSKFSAATEIKEIDGKKVPYFGNSSMAKWAKTAKKDYMEDFRNGDIWISAIHVEPKEFASLLEVYLHVWCATKEELPPINKRIG